MMVFRSPAEVPASFGPSVAVIGKFDGVHRGHRAVIAQARKHAARIGAQTVAVTFDRNPLALLRPDRCPIDLDGPEHKLQLLQNAGVDATLMLTFDHALAGMSAREFATDILAHALAAKVVLVGKDFRFGKGGQGDVSSLSADGAELGFDVEVVADVNTSTQQRVSSTAIRSLLAEGDVAAAAELLGRSPAVRGEVVHGFKRGRELGFPTANLGGVVHGFIPADGVYAGWLIDPEPGLDGAVGRRYPAAVSVGSNPTFDDVTERQVEAYVLDMTDLDLYHHRVEVQFTERIRGMTAFEDIDSLVTQITADVAAVRSALGA